jgi:5'(3')-deoxyribonucleotidase/2'-5' RNA ligase
MKNEKKKLFEMFDKVCGTNLLIKESLNSSERIMHGTGLLLKLDNNTLQSIQNMNIPDNLTRLDNKNLHVTLTSIRNFKPFKEDFESVGFDDIEIPNIELGNTTIAKREEQGKESFVVAVKNQDELKRFVDEIYEKVGKSNPEPDRYFHITIANNKEGNPFGSIGDVTKADFGKSESSGSIQVWFDLDGVLADMEGGLEKVDEFRQEKEAFDSYLNSNYPELSDLSDDELKIEINNLVEANPNDQSAKQLKKLYRNYTNKVFKVAKFDDFFYNLDMMPDSIEFLKLAYKLTGNKPNILSSPVGDENDPNNKTVIDKKRWVQKNFGDLVNDVVITTNKDSVVKSKNDILVDDRIKYTSLFSNAGGSVVLYKNSKQAMMDLEKLVK